MLPSTRNSRPCCDGADRARRQQGFTLLEVLIAFAVLAIMLVPLLQVFGGGLGTTQTARAYTRATLLARSRLAEIGVDEKLQEGERSGTFDEPGYRWRTIVALDETAIQAPADEAVPRRRRPRTLGSGDDGTSGSSFGRSRSSFGSSSGTGSSSFGSSGTGSSGTGSRFGSSSGFGSSNTGSRFGQSQGSGLSSRSGSRSAAGSSGVGRGATASDSESADADGEQTLTPFLVTVVVEWGEGTAQGSVTLNSVRLYRPDDGLDETGDRQ